MNRIAIEVAIVCLLVARNCLAGEIQTFACQEPFGLDHKNEILEFDLARNVDLGAVRLLDADGVEVPFQITRRGKKLLLRTDLAANERRNWKLVDGKPTRVRPAAATPATKQSKPGMTDGKPPVNSSRGVEVVKNNRKGWYEITNGLTGVRVPLANQFVNELAGLSEQEVVNAEKQENGAEELKAAHRIFRSNPAPVQGIQLRNGNWTATGPNWLQAKGLCTGAKVELVEEGPFEVVVKLSYLFKAKPAIPKSNVHPEWNPGYPGGDGHYTCTITVQAGEPSILFDEDSDVITSWRLNVFPEMNPDSARHPGLIEDGRIMEIDFSIPYDADYHTSYETRGKGITHLYPCVHVDTVATSESYWLLFNSVGGVQSPVMGVFSDKSARSENADASGPGLVCSDNWMGSGGKGSGFNVQIGRATPDARSFPFVRLRWGLFVGTKGTGLASLGKKQPILEQMNRHGGTVARLRDTASKLPQPPRLDSE